MSRTFPLLAVLTLALLAAPFLACDDEPPDGDADADTDVDSDSDTDADGDVGPAWSVEVINRDDVGRFASLDVSRDGAVGVAYYDFNARQGEICDVLGDDRLPESRHPIYYSFLEAGATEWQTETVVEALHLDSPTGLSFRFAPDGTPSLGLYVGDPIDVLCSANDAGFATRRGGSWSIEVAASTSGQAAVPPDATCSAAASTAGYAVGSWPALGFDSAGNPAIAYRDTHFGGMQRDDIHRADAEVAQRRGGWSQEMVDCGDGGGRDNALVFDSEDRLVVVHRITTESHIDSRHGLWAHRREADGTWLRVRVTVGQTGFGESSLVALDEERLALVYYDAGQGHPFVAELELPELFADGGGWLQVDIGDNRYDEGLYPSIAVSPRGRLAVAYYRCNRAGSSGGSCSDDQDALIFAYRNAAGTWVREVVDQGARGACGTHGSIAFEPDGSVRIAYVCVQNIAGSEFVSELKVATRRPL